MNRRGFLTKLIGGVAASAAVRTFPFRVFSFPAAIAKPTFEELAALHCNAMMDYLTYSMRLWERVPHSHCRIINVRAYFPESEIAPHLKPENRVVLA